VVLAVPDAYINAHFPFGKLVLAGMNLGTAFVLESLLFAAIYKTLPDTDIEWHDVLVGAVSTAFLFGVGKLLIGLYLKSSAIASTYGAAGGLIALLLWIYYSAQIFLFGAEFTKAYACREGSQQDRPDLIAPTAALAVEPAIKADSPARSSPPAAGLTRGSIAAHAEPGVRLGGRP